MDDVQSYLAETRRASKRLFYSLQSQSITTHTSMDEVLAFAPKLPPKVKRSRSPIVEYALPKSGDAKAPVNFSRLGAGVLRAIRLRTPTVARQHLPDENFVRATMERYCSIRERMISLRLMIREEHGDRSELLRKPVADVARLLTRTQNVESSTRSHFFDFPLGKPVSEWFKFIEFRGPFAPLYSTGLPFSESGLPAMGMFSLATDGDLNNLFCVVLTKVVRGCQDSRHDEFRGARAESTAVMNSERSRKLTSIVSLFEEAPSWVEVHTSLFPGLEHDIQLFLASLMPVSLAVDGSARIIPGFGVWIYSVLIAVELPLDPSNERLLQQLFQLVCRSITDLRSKSASWAADQSERAEETLCSLDTLLVILCRHFKLNNRDLVPL